MFAGETGIKVFSVFIRNARCFLTFCLLPTLPLPPLMSWLRVPVVEEIAEDDEEEEEEEGEKSTLLAVFANMLCNHSE